MAIFATREVFGESNDGSGGKVAIEKIGVMFADNDVIFPKETINGGNDNWWICIKIEKDGVVTDAAIKARGGGNFGVIGARKNKNSEIRNFLMEVAKFIDSVVFGVVVYDKDFEVGIEVVKGGINRDETFFKNVCVVLGDKNDGDDEIFFHCPIIFRIAINANL